MGSNPTPAQQTGDTMDITDKHKDSRFTDIGSTNFRMVDEVGANVVTAQIIQALEALNLAAEHVAETNVDLSALKKLLSKDKNTLESFFIVNMILKGFLLMIDGQEWDRYLEAGNHQYSPNVMKFLREVHNHTFDEPPPEKPKVIPLK